MTHESGSISSSKHRGALSCTRWMAFIGRNGGETRKLRVDYVSKVSFPRGKAEGLTRQISSLGLTRKFWMDWFKISLLAEAKTTVRLGVKLW